MTLARTAGFGLTILGLLGYSVGVVRAYPGRSFSIAAVMLGLTLLGVHRLDAVGESP